MPLSDKTIRCAHQSQEIIRIIKTYNADDDRKEYGDQYRLKCRCRCTIVIFFTDATGHNSSCCHADTHRQGEHHE